jgi:hypothetical protein
MCYGRKVVTTGVHYGGEEYQSGDMPPLITAPLSSPVFIAVAMSLSHKLITLASNNTQDSIEQVRGRSHEEVQVRFLC